MNETRDVVVVGAGPVGLMLACELRLAGVDVLVVERLSEPDMTVKAGAINAPTAQAMDRRGMLPQLIEAQRAVLAHFGGRGGAGSNGRPPVFGHFAGIMVDPGLIDLEDAAFAGVGPAGQATLVAQQAIESILAQRAAELGVVVRRGVEVGEFTDDGVGVTVACGDRVVRTAWLVGCDGGRSTVRKRAGFEFPGLDPEITGRQALVRMTGTEGLQPGWNTTPTGIYVHGPMPGRLLTVEVDGPPADRDAPVSAEELRDSLYRVSGVRVRIDAVQSATRFTDNTRQVPEYRKGRVLLAGDAAHVHSPFGGQGLNLGMGDAVNLGWKLAAVIRGRASEDLLDTYTGERHPIGAWVLEWTRAQVALMRTDPRSRAMRALTTELLASTPAATTVFKKIAGVLHRYDLGSDHPLVGAAPPDLPLSDGTRLAEHFATGTGILLDLTDSPTLAATAARHPDHIRLVTAKPAQPTGFSALLIRPDGIVAWAADTSATEGLEQALTRWFGTPRLIRTRAVPIAARPTRLIGVTPMLAPDSGGLVPASRDEPFEGNAATRGIGSTIAEVFARDSATVVVSDYPSDGDTRWGGSRLSSR
ncbi:FAD-dependent monooxygenase [Nocardia crassostreae]|uniref:FAD-dependent monooxygenase n=1 Tax=Nocardia crassostreae TaxID=53428 RepID=UPI000834B7B4|nr:FAD-dependent monooxygenase [Nocardia crassostreae]